MTTMRPFWGSWSLMHQEPGSGIVAWSDDYDVTGHVVRSAVLDSTWLAAFTVLQADHPIVRLRLSGKRIWFPEAAGGDGLVDEMGWKGLEWPDVQRCLPGISLDSIGTPDRYLWGAMWRVVGFYAEDENSGAGPSLHVARGIRILRGLTDARDEIYAGQTPDAQLFLAVSMAGALDHLAWKFRTRE